jgi:hypothetical protein
LSLPQGIFVLSPKACCVALGLFICTTPCPIGRASVRFLRYQPRKANKGSVRARQNGGPYPEVKMETDKHQINTHRVITMLDRKELEFLDKLGKDALFSTGHKLSYNEILKGLIEFAMDLRLSAEGVNSLNALKEKILNKMHNGLDKPEGSDE